MKLVTGGSGFVGRALVEALRARGEPVRILDRRSPPWLDASAFIPGLLEFVPGDVTDATVVQRAMGGVDTVYHLAAQLLLASSQDSLTATNVGGTQVVLEAAVAAGVSRVVYTSTGMLYPHRPGRAVVEEEPPAPSGPYGASKVAAEAVFARFEGRGPTLTLLRPLFVLGSGRLGLLHLLFDRISRNRPVYLVGGGHNRFHMIAVEDLAQACILAAEKGVPGVFNVGVEQPSTVRAQLEALIRHVGSRSPVRPLPRHLVEAGTRVLSPLGLAPIQGEQSKVAWQDRVLDTTRARYVLGWRPQRTDVEAMIAAYEAWQKLRLLPRDHQSDWPDGGILSIPLIDKLF